MAGDWIKMRKSLPTDGRIVRMMSALNADRLRTLGGLMSAWCLLDEHTEDGKLDGYTPAAFDEIIGFQGLALAMETVGWLEIGDGFLKAPDFERHNGVTAKRRAQETVRKMSARNADKCPQEKQTKSAPEKRREEKRRDGNTPLPPEGESPRKVLRSSKASEMEANITAADHAPIPLELNVPAFQDAWTDWLTYRADLHRSNPQKPWTALAAQKTLNQCAKHGVGASVAAINGTISNGWQGLVWDKFEDEPTTPRTQSTYEAPRAKEVTWEEHLRLTWDGDEESLQETIQVKKRLDAKFNLTPDAV